MRSELILVVCAANVCRSPLAELLLRCGLEGVPEVRTGSAGTLARTGSGICALVEGFRGDEAWGEAARAHRSRLAEPDLLQQAALILVSSRDVRADVVLSMPEVRGRTYTLREAAHLGEGFDPTFHARHLGVVSRYAAHLDRSRVVRGAAPSGRRRWVSGRYGGGPDIVDGHGRGRWAHRGAAAKVVEATSVVIGQLGGKVV